MYKRGREQILPRLEEGSGDVRRPRSTDWMAGT